jgi:hypothetical protein
MASEVEYNAKHSWLSSRRAALACGEVVVEGMFEL